MAKFGTLLVRKQQNLAKFFLSVNTLRKVLLVLPGLDTWQIFTGTQNLTDYGCLERGHQLFGPEKAN